MRKSVVTDAGEILEVLNRFPDGARLEEIRKYSKSKTHLRSTQRRVHKLIDEGVIKRTGKARATIYILATNGVTSFVQEDAALTIPLSIESRRIHALISAPIQQRKPIGYRLSFLESYRPNIDSYLSEAEQAQLNLIGDTKINLPAGTYAQQILHRLLIDLSWNSSRLEGNTYSLLDTERLILLGEANDSNTAKEAQMILNHKDAIEFIVQAASDIGFNRYTVLNLHAMLANNLLSDPMAPGRLRSIAVGIAGSVFTPLAIPQIIEEQFDLLLKKASQIKNPWEQSFFMMVHLPYLQPFDDVNKRVSRLTANISLVQHNLSPLSFIDVPDRLYTQGMLAVYELNEVNLLKDIFLWACERSAARYAVIRQTLGDPDPFKLKYRQQIRDLISQIIVNSLNRKSAGELIKKEADSLPQDDQTQFTEALNTELGALHDGNFARYRVSQKEFNQWKKGSGQD